MRKDLQDSRPGKVEWFDDMAADFRDTASYKAYVISVRRLFERSPTPLTIGEIKRLQGENFQPRRIFDALESIDGLLEVGVKPMRWRLSGKR